MVNRKASFTNLIDYQVRSNENPCRPTNSFHMLTALCAINTNKRRIGSRSKVVKNYNENETEMNHLYRDSKNDEVACLESQMQLSRSSHTGHGE